MARPSAFGCHGDVFALCVHMRARDVGEDGWEIKGQLMSSTVLDLVISLGSKCLFLGSANHLPGLPFFNLIHSFV